MTFKVLRGGLRVSINSTTTAAFVPGQMAKLDASDNVALCDNVTLPIGVFFDDSATEVSVLPIDKATVVMGDFEGETNQWVSGIAYSDKLASSTGGKFQTAVSGDRAIAIALNTPSATKDLHFVWFGGVTLIV